MESYQVLLLVLFTAVIILIVLPNILRMLRKNKNIYDEEEGKYPFAIHFLQILKRINDYEDAFYEHPKPKKKIYKLYAMILSVLCFAILIASNIFVSISILLFLGYGFCYIKLYRLWKLYGYSKLIFWFITLVLFVICFLVAPYIRACILNGLEAIMNR